jgi:hypothetical protein
MGSTPPVFVRRIAVEGLEEQLALAEASGASHEEQT